MGRAWPGPTGGIAAARPLLLLPLSHPPRVPRSQSEINTAVHCPRYTEITLLYAATVSQILCIFFQLPKIVGALCQSAGLGFPGKARRLASAPGGNNELPESGSQGSALQLPADSGQRSVPCGGDRPWRRGGGAGPWKTQVAGIWPFPYEFEDPLIWSPSSTVYAPRTRCPFPQPPLQLESGHVAYAPL